MSLIDNIKNLLQAQPEKEEEVIQFCNNYIHNRLKS